MSWHGVVVPLLLYVGEEFTHEFSIFTITGRAAMDFLRGGRDTRKERGHQSRNFDCTKGYQGEDIPPN